MTAEAPLAAVIRGGYAESRHSRRLCHCRAGWRPLFGAAGDIEHPVYPRSAIKALQCLAVIESGAADRFGFSPCRVALACASHGGEPDHVATAGAHAGQLGPRARGAGMRCPLALQLRPPPAEAVARVAATPLEPSTTTARASMPGMLAVAEQLGVPPIMAMFEPGHPVQQRHRRHSRHAPPDRDTAAAPCGIDGCSVPTWALPPARASPLPFIALPPAKASRPSPCRGRPAHHREQSATTPSWLPERNASAPISCARCPAPSSRPGRKT